MYVNVYLFIHTDTHIVCIRVYVSLRTHDTYIYIYACVYIYVYKAMPVANTPCTMTLGRAFDGDHDSRWAGRKKTADCGGQGAGPNVSRALERGRESASSLQTWGEVLHVGS